MANQAKASGAGKQNLTKAQIEARQKAESLVVTNPSQPKQNAIIKSSPTLKKMFNQLKKLNDHFTEADSISLNTLTFNLHLKAMNEQKLFTLHIEHDEYERYLVRLEKIDKKINESMKQLCIPLNNRLSLANDMAKVMIEEKKLEQMNGIKPQETNPLMTLLQKEK
ncbi:hypothetical protein LAV79_22770 [Peribacillus butanolivorans]|uniref:hypothetical protein n=1 Tax=Peribacillus butanolivorans TaxID=421767 RepID=UPI0030C9DF2B